MFEVKLFCVDMPDSPYYQLSVKLACENLAQQLEMDFETIPKEAIATAESSATGVFICDCHVFARLTTFPDLKRRFPNLKFCTLATDSGYDHLCEARNSVQNLEEVDLYLDLEQATLDRLSKEGYTNLGGWAWTISEVLLEDFLKRPRPPKDYDFVCMFNRNAYRDNLVRTLINGGYSVRYGGIPYALDALFGWNSRARFCVGTSSGSWYNMPSVKGFRNGVAIASGTICVFDSIQKKIASVPFPWEGYDFDDPATIIPFAKSLLPVYNEAWEVQVDWLKGNTLEKQFLRKIGEFNLI